MTVVTGHRTDCIWLGVKPEACGYCTSYPFDPSATSDEQALLDEYNGLMLALRTLNAGERLTGLPAAGTRREIEHRAQELVWAARRLRP